ncbi:hypothetical protein COLO4_20770 [Corchorus olitorius]|uniref:Uncharacterized protein n=1 Tax=Corchorus olitorius TaxID=93759 RepID=A0A1R3IX36_9ROSI|nr:hypothetical protein COLO4_20770 [Corchorus olitorius]
MKTIGKKNSNSSCKALKSSMAANAILGESLSFLSDDQDLPMGALTTFQIGGFPISTSDKDFPLLSIAFSSVMNKIDSKSNAASDSGEKLKGLADGSEGKHATNVLQKSELMDQDREKIAAKNVVNMLTTGPNWAYVLNDKKDATFKFFQPSMADNEKGTDLIKQNNQSSNGFLKFMRKRK